MSQQEIWKDYNGSIKQFQGKIKVSNLGRIFDKKNKKILKKKINNKGYERIDIIIDGKRYNKPVHKIIAETFIPKKNNKFYIDHINDIKNDNRACNLRWIQYDENLRNPFYKEKQEMILTKKGNIISENINGFKLVFKSKKDLKSYFKTKANIDKIIKKNDFVKTKKSKLYGWKIYYTS